MVEAVETLDGWYSLHDMRLIDWKAWKKASVAERKEAIDDFLALFNEWDKVEKAENGSQVMYQAIGQQADLMFMFLRPTMEELANVETAFNKSKLVEFLRPAYSHLSVIELSKYNPKTDEADPEVQKRLRPILPKWKHMSYYPMSRRREGDYNWYTLEKKERAKLLYEHSLTGRQYAGEVKQFITGSIGFDEWEWGVTLFAHDAIQLKKVVYEMRFDEATSRYGEFSKFFVGNYLSTDDLQLLLDVEA